MKIATIAATISAVSALRINKENNAGSLVSMPKSQPSTLAQVKGFLWIETKREKSHKEIVKKCHDASIYGKAQCEFNRKAAEKLAGKNAVKLASAT